MGPAWRKEPAVDVSLPPFDLCSPDLGLLVGETCPKAQLAEAWGQEGPEALASN